MFLAGGHAGPTQPWSSKSDPSRKFLLPFARSCAGPFIRCAAAERWDPARAADFGRPPRPIRGTQRVGGHPPSPPRQPGPCGRAHANTAGHTHTRPGTRVCSAAGPGPAGIGVRGVWGAGFCGGCGFLGGPARSEASAGPAGWGRAMWHVALRGPRCHATPGAAPGPCHPPAPQNGHPAAGAPQNPPRAPVGDTPAGPNPGTAQGRRSPEHPLDGPQEHPLRDPSPEAPPRTTGTPKPSPRAAGFVFSALFSFPLSPSFPWLLSLPALPPWHGSTAVSTFEGATLVGKSRSSWTMIHNLPCNLGRL